MKPLGRGGERSLFLGQRREHKRHRKRIKSLHFAEAPEVCPRGIEAALPLAKDEESSDIDT
jgi:hypothetical protein